MVGGGRTCLMLSQEVWASLSWVFPLAGCVAVPGMSISALNKHPYGPDGFWEDRMMPAHCRAVGVKGCKYCCWVPSAASVGDAGMEHPQKISAGWRREIFCELPLQQPCLEQDPTVQHLNRCPESKKNPQNTPSVPPRHAHGMQCSSFFAALTLNASESSLLSQHLFQELVKLSCEICAARHAKNFN